MRSWGRGLVPVIALALAVSIAPVAAAAPATGAPSTARPGPAAQPRHPDRPITRLVVRTRDGSTASTRIRGAAASLAGLDAVSLVGTRSRGRTLLGLGRGLSTAEAWSVAKALEKRADVLWAQPDLWVYPAASPVVPNDPAFPDQWDLWADSGYSTHAAAAWTRTTGRPDVVVAVLDTGLTVHPDITSSVTAPRSTDPIVRGYDFVSLDDVSITSTPILRSWTANDGNGRDPDPSDPGDWITTDDNLGVSANGWFQGCADPTDPTAEVFSSWHGTFVTGTLVARQGNARGGSGMVPGIKVQPLRVLGRCGGYSSDIDDAITWASGGHVDGVPDNTTPASVVSLSLGGPGSCLPSTQEAIDGARSRGAAVVVAAGNEGIATAGGGSQPADCTGVVTAVAVDSNGTRPLWSNYGDVPGSLVVAAPGVRTFGPTNTGESTPASATYEWGSGTSFATPHVSGLVALLQSLRAGRAAYTPVEIEARLTAMARTTAGCPAGTCGVGVLDVGTTGQNLPAFAPEAPTGLLADVRTTSVDLRWTPGDTGGRATTYTVQRSTGGAWSDAGPAWTGLSTTSTTVTGLTTGTAYSFRVVATNALGSATSAPVGPETPSPTTVPGLVATGGVAAITAAWTANPDAGAAPVYRLRYRKAGAPAWTTAPDTAAGATSAVLPTPVDATAGGTWEVQASVVVGGAPAGWSDSRTAVVRAYAPAFSTSAAVLRPYVDGFQDTVVLRASTNRTGGSSGTMRITNSLGQAVRIIALGTASSWAWTWNATSGTGRRVPNGTYTVSVALRDPTGALTDVVQAKPVTVVVASSQATRPTMTLSTASLFPYRDGYLDATAIRTTTAVPSVITWRLVRSGRTYWSTTFSRRLSASAAYAGARTGGGTVPAGTYVLYAYATGGEGTTVSSYRYVTVSSKRRVAHAFTRSWSSASTTFKSSVPASGAGGAFVNGSSVIVPGGAVALFAGAMPATVSPYSSLRVAITTAPPEGAALPRAGYYLGTWTNPETLRYQKLRSTGGVLPAPTSSGAGAGSMLRWWVSNTGSGSTDTWVSSVTVTGYYYSLV